MSLLPNYSPFFAATLGTIYSRRWEPAPKYEGRSLLVAPPPIQNIAFWHVQVRPRGEVYVPPEWVEQYLAGLDSTSPPIIPGQNLTLPQYTLLANANGVSQLDGQGRTYGSIFKVRMRWKEGPELRQIDCDLGAGIDVITPPASFVEVELLSPVAGSELSVPSFVRDIPLGTALQVDARVDCLMGTAERNFNAKFTDIVYYDPEIGQERQIIIPRRQSTTRFQASVSGSSLLGSIKTSWDRNVPGTPGDPFRRLDTGTFAGQLGDRNTAINDIPGGTNVFQYSFAPNAGQSTLTVVQELSF